MTPRIRMGSVASAFAAGSVDRDAAVLSLNGLKNNVILIPGENVSITQVDSTLVISASVVGGGDDGDWSVVGDNIHRPTGRIFVGQPLVLAPLADPNPEAAMAKGTTMPATSKMEIMAQNEGFSVLMQETNPDSDGRAAIYGKREASPRNHGTGMGPDESNAAITGLDISGDSYTFGMSAFGNPYYTNSGALLASNSIGSLWSSLVFRDNNNDLFGMYTTGDIHSGGKLESEFLYTGSIESDYLDVGTFAQMQGGMVVQGVSNFISDITVNGQISTNGFRLNTSTAAGYILTSNQYGTASWAPPSAAQSDGDWEIVGEDIYRTSGRIYVGEYKGGKEEAENDAKGWPDYAKLEIEGINEGIAVNLQMTNPASDGNAAVYGRLTSSPRNHGTGFGIDQINAGVLGDNSTGDRFAFGVVGYDSPTYGTSGAVLGAHVNGTYWASLAYMDPAYQTWGMYTPNDVHCGGVTETTNLRVTDGASSGYILTSDGIGNATWSAPGASQSDGDWDISGTHLIHAAPGAVAIGTANPHPLMDASSFTTIQISAENLPALCLDQTSSSLRRWSLYANNGRMYFAKSESYSELGVTTLSMVDGLVEVCDFSGNAKIKLQGEADDSQGGRYYSYSTSGNTSLPTVELLSQANTSSVGGLLRLRNQYGQDEVLITANHDQTNVGRITTPVLEITGGSDLSEQFDLGNTSELTRPGMVVSIDPHNPGKLTLSVESYDRKVAGVLSGAGGVNTGMLMGQRGTEVDGEFPVALVGRVYVWADATHGPIEPGDLLTTSDNPGHAMKVTDNSKAMGAILGKAMTGLTEGQGLVLTLISLQ